MDKGTYNYGVIINSIENKYEVYCYVVSKDEKYIVSSLLLKEFNTIEKSLEYFKMLGEIMKDNNITYLLDKCKIDQGT